MRTSSNKMTDDNTNPQDPQNGTQDAKTAADASSNSATNLNTEEQSRLEAAEKRAAEMTEAAQRALADLQNFKRRAEEERAQLGVYANMKLLQAIFPALDNFARAFEHLPEEIADHEWIKGIEATEKNFMQALTTLGLAPIDQAGIPADPNQHEILMEAPGPKGQVLQIFEKGYTFNGKTVRPAKVQVGNGEESK